MREGSGKTQLFLRDISRHLQNPIAGYFLWSLKFPKRLLLFEGVEAWKTLSGKVETNRRSAARIVERSLGAERREESGDRERDTARTRATRGTPKEDGPRRA